jgi:hypothetical protein
MMSDLDRIQESLEKHLGVYKCYVDSNGESLKVACKYLAPVFQLAIESGIKVALGVALTQTQFDTKQQRRASAKSAGVDAAITFLNPGDSNAPGSEEEPSSSTADSGVVQATQSDEVNECLTELGTIRDKIRNAKATEMVELVKEWEVVIDDLREALEPAMSLLDLISPADWVELDEWLDDVSQYI